MAIERLSESPFAVLSFLVAPAVLTNASTVLILSTSNRLARVVDEMRRTPTRADDTTALFASNPAYRLERLQTYEQRVMLLMRALNVFYGSVGSFAGASLVSLVGASLFVLNVQSVMLVTLGLGFCGGVLGVGGLVFGSSLLVWETRLTIPLLQREAAELVRKLRE